MLRLSPFFITVHDKKRIKLFSNIDTMYILMNVSVHEK